MLAKLKQKPNFPALHLQPKWTVFAIKKLFSPELNNSNEDDRRKTSGGKKASANQNLSVTYYQYQMRVDVITIVRCYLHEGRVLLH